MKNKTAIEWLKEKLPSLFLDDSGHYKELFQQALEMEKEQIIDAIFFGIHLEYNNIDSPLESAEQYYNETFSNTGD